MAGGLSVVAHKKITGNRLILIRYGVLSVNDKNNKGFWGTTSLAVAHSGTEFTR